VVDFAGHTTGTYRKDTHMTRYEQRRTEWRQHCMETLTQFGVEIRQMPSGAVRLIGLHGGDMTMTDIADLHENELRDFTRIRT
jgi:hypothetical protein